MMGLYSANEAILAVAGLTETRLIGFIEAEIVQPVRTEQGPVFAETDLARLEFLCEMAEVFDLEGEALAVVISLVDQLYRTRQDLRELVRAIADQPPEVRQGIGARFLKRHPG